MIQHSREVQEPGKKKSGKVRVSLSIRFLLLVLPVMLLVSLVFMGVLARTELQYIEQLRYQSVESSSRNLAAIIANPLWNFDQKQTRVLMNTALKQEGLACARLELATGSEAGITVGDCEGQNLEQFTEQVEYYQKGTPIKLGELRLHAAINPGWKDIAGELVSIGTMTLALFAAIIFSAIFAFRMTIFRPLQRVSDSLREYSRTGVRQPVDWPDRDELGVLIREYNDSLEQQALAEQNLENQLRFEQTLKDTLPIPIALVTMDLQLQDMNPAFFRELDLPPEHGEPLLAADNLPGIDWEAMLGAGVSEVVRTELTLESGPLAGQTWIVHASPVVGAIGFRYGIVIALLNITERMAAEQEANAARSEAERALHELQDAQKSLLQAEKMASLGSLVAGITHEINTPVGNSLTVATSMEDRLKSFRQELASGALRKSSLESFLDSVDEAGKILIKSLEVAAGQISNFKQVAVDQSSSQRRQFNLSEVVDEVIYTLRPRIKHTPHRVEVDVPDNIRMESFPGPLGQIITNLFNNALIHGFDGMDEGVVRITAEQIDESTVAVSVEDNGCGIPEAHQARIFDPFFTTRMGKGGSGLGLNLVYTLATGVLGGEVSLAWTSDQGSCFKLTLPLQAPASLSATAGQQANE